MKFPVLTNTILSSTLILLTACGGGGGGGGGGGSIGPVPTSLEIPNISGTTTVLENTLRTTCLASGSDSMLSVINFNADTVTVTNLLWVGNTTCSGSPSAIDGYSGTATVDSFGATITDWATLSIDINNMAVLSGAGSPDAMDGSGPLSAVEPFSVINIDVTSITGNPGLDVGAKVSYGFVVDGTGATPVLYGVFNDNVLGIVGVVNQYFYIPATASSTVNVATASGGTFGLDGVWVTGCMVSGTSGRSTTISVTQVDLIIEDSTWVSDTSCSGTPSSLVSYIGDINTNATQTLSGWVDEFNNPASGPNAMNGSGPLADNVSYTLLSSTLVDASDPNIIGATINLFFVVDDSVPGMPLLYNGDPGNSQANNAWPFYRQ